MYICTYVCTYVHLIWILMSGKCKYEKDKSDGDLLWPLCPEKFWIFQTVLIGEIRYIWAAHCTTLLADIDKDSFVSKGKIPSTRFFLSYWIFFAKLAGKVCQELATLFGWQDNRKSSDPTSSPLAPASINRVLGTSRGRMLWWTNSATEKRILPTTKFNFLKAFGWIKILYILCLGKF